jgi:hypothetical protein
MIPREEELAAMVNARFEQRKAEGSRLMLARLSSALGFVGVTIGTHVALRLLLGHTGAPAALINLMAATGGRAAGLVTAFALFKGQITKQILLKILAVFIGYDGLAAVQAIFRSGEEPTHVATMVVVPAITLFVTLALSVWLFQRQKRAEENAERERLLIELRASLARR